MRSSRLWILFTGVAILPLSVGHAQGLVSANYVGPESCKSCHPDAYAAWRQSKHSRAMDSLSPQQQQDARCLSCHGPDQKARNVPSVSCETCHGAGQYYAAEYVMKDPELVRMVGLDDPSEKSCRACHDASSPSLRPFDFVEKLKLIDHWTAERKKREEAKTAAAQPDAKKPPAKK